MQHKLLDIRHLRVDYNTTHFNKNVLSNFHLTVAQSETLGIVGESGSGKTMAMLATARLLPNNMKVTAGEIFFNGQDLLKIPRNRFYNEVSGKKIAMIFQEPMTALNPVHNVRQQLLSSLKFKGLPSAVNLDKHLVEALEAVKLDSARQRLQQFPHELSGGQRQRVMIAMALIQKPCLLIADEPTTALDVTVQNEIIELLNEIQSTTKMGLIFISHDLSVVSRVSKNLLVMQNGQIVEEGDTREILQKPKHHYTSNLLNCIKNLEKTASCSVTLDKSKIIECKSINKTFSIRRGLLGKKTKITALKNISFHVEKGETLAVVGESGSGKSTLAKILNGLIDADSGEVKIYGMSVDDLNRNTRAKFVQPVFQDPYSTLNPRQTIGYIVSRPLIINQGVTYENALIEAEKMLDKVGISHNFLHRFPNQLSGGQRQRVAIARAMILKPKVLICDEPTSALDVSIQEQILELIKSLKANFGVTLILISHDIAVVRHLADRVLVMLNGEILESGTAKVLLNNPEHKYTKKLISSVYKIPQN